MARWNADNKSGASPYLTDSTMFRKLSLFISNIKSELKKCSWPWESDSKIKGFKKYRELCGSTMVVLVAMVLLGAYVAFFDFVMARVVTWAIEQLS